MSPKIGVGFVGREDVVAHLDGLVREGGLVVLVQLAPDALHSAYTVSFASVSSSSSSSCSAVLNLLFFLGASMRVGGDKLLNCARIEFLLE